jgi:5-methylcytosine-specific restriction endonuclease McrA
VCHNPPTRENHAAGEAIPFDHTLVLERKVTCQKCHGDMVVGDGSVPKIRCNSCHGDAEKIEQYSNGPLMHKNHITDHKIECDQCHTAIQHKSVSRSEWVKPDCNACHPDFHNAQLKLFSGKGGKGIPNHPSPMFESGLNCQACHLYHQASDGFEDKGAVTVANAGSCESCHGKGYGTMIERWKSQTNRSIEKLVKILDTTKKIVSDNPAKPGFDNAKKKLEDADYNYKLVKFGNSIHNIAFANQLLKKSYNLAQECLRDVESDQQLPEFMVEEPITPGDCYNCHSDLMKGKEIPAFGLSYSHDRHINIQKLPCSTCHSNEQVHGQLVVDKKDCMACHHSEERFEKQPQCGSCHKTQQAFYFSKFQFAELDSPNVMVEDVGCLDCHKNEDDQIYRPGKQTCVECHDEDYGKTHDEWQKTSEEWIRKLREKVKNENLKEGDKAFDTLKLLEKDGSKGMHNPELYETLAEEALKKK